MDKRRWNTGQVLASGILGLPAPKSAKPRGTKLVEVDEEDLSPETLRAGLLQGGLTASMYYGCWHIWKTAAGFSGELFQYHQITERFADLPLEEAVEQAAEWGSACYG